MIKCIKLEQTDLMAIRKRCRPDTGYNAIGIYHQLQYCLTYFNQSPNHYLSIIKIQLIYLQQKKMKLKQIYHINLYSSKLMCFVIPKLFTHIECQQLLSKYTKQGFQKAIHNYPSYYRNNERIVVDDLELANNLYNKIYPYIPKMLFVQNGISEKQEGVWQPYALNQKIRFCKYQANQYFRKHLDGIHYRSPVLHSKLTFMVYLNSAKNNFIGGRTLFFKDADSKQIQAAYQPVQGDLIIFDHNLWHEGQALSSGEKFVMRSDIIYKKVKQLVNSEKPTDVASHKKFGSGHQGYIWTLLAWSQDLMLSGGRDKSIRVWNKKGQCIQKIQGHLNSILDLLKFDQKTFVSCSRDKHINIWNLINGKFQLANSWVGHENSTVLTLAKLNNELIASGGADFNIKIAQFPSGCLVKTLHGHTNWVWRIVKIKQQLLVSCSEDFTIRIWNWKSGKQLFKVSHSLSIHSMVFSQHRNQLYVGDLLGNLICYKLTIKNIDKQRTKQDIELNKFYEKNIHSSIIRSLQIIQQNYLVSGSEDRYVRIWKIEDQFKLIKQMRHQNFVQDLCFFNGQLLSASYDGTIQRAIQVNQL